ncbi:YdeI/OmpD-associated family protein [Sphingomonas daechungensis]|nr:YdeI/OmpD-associated family protein [Sphingomonas daechungensis]
MELLAEGRMRKSGVAQVDAAKADGRWDAAYAPASSAKIPPDLQDALDANPEAAKFFATLKGANRYAILYRIGSVKRPETRARKIADYVAMLERGETIHG